MAENKEVMAWVKELGQQAFTEARGGNVAMLNRLGVNSSLKLFLDNVIGTGNVVAESFPAFYPVQWCEIVRLHEEYLLQSKVVENVDKVATLESRFDKLESMIAEFIEAQKKPVVEAVEKPAKKGKKAEVEAVAETETETDESAESEA